ncbi:hypothetical protein HMPREF3213_02260 [Heyndrickxia coagulans]|uniref:Uncharacterized protein n=1 Tax=Heyndrickxia coagulans TaxID=1398 RepID=A0A133KLY9_HEYCO|nr:hypothetical protein HMPREF3213_02260 [Heyndrickxia coagulans]
MQTFLVFTACSCVEILSIENPYFDGLMSFSTQALWYRSSQSILVTIASNFQRGSQLEADFSHTLALRMAKTFLGASSRNSPDHIQPFRPTRSIRRQHSGFTMNHRF